jgi:alkylhydroperoxidase/carboxymuconolactone decarboxylase family protein YurZ
MLPQGTPASEAQRLERLVNQTHEELLRRLALNDEAAVDVALEMNLSDVQSPGLEPKTWALVRLAGLIALQSAPSSYEWGVTAALAAGATDEEVIGVLVALTPVVGLARVNRAAVEVAAAIGCDLGTRDGS